MTHSNYEVYGLPILKHLCEKLSKRLKKDRVYGTTVSVIVKTAGFKRYTRQAALDHSTDDAAVIFKTASSLMKELLFSSDGLFTNGEALRLIGVGVSKLDDGQNRQMDLSDWMNEIRRKGSKEKQQKLDAMMTSVRDKYGEEVLRKGMRGRIDI